MPCARPGRVRLVIDVVPDVAGARIRLAVDGELDITHSPVVSAAIRAAAGSAEICLDLRDAGFVSLSSLVAAFDAARAVEVPLEVVHASPATRRLIALLESAGPTADRRDARTAGGS